MQQPGHVFVSLQHPRHACVQHPGNACLQGVGHAFFSHVCFGGSGAHRCMRCSSEDSTGQVVPAHAVEACPWEVWVSEDWQAPRALCLYTTRIHIHTYTTRMGIHKQVYTHTSTKSQGCCSSLKQPPLPPCTAGLLEDLLLLKVLKKDVLHAHQVTSGALIRLLPFSRSCATLLVCPVACSCVRPSAHAPWPPAHVPFCLLSLACSHAPPSAHMPLLPAHLRSHGC